MTIDALQDQTVHLPRILCLHGGGTNARIFRLQCRILIRHLQSNFRLVFAEAPFTSEAGPDVTSVYKEYGPFRRWLRFLPHHPDIGAESTIEKIEDSLQDAKMEDNLKGATGEWVGLLGFSQGAKMCASLLLRQQILVQKLGRHRSPTNYRFAVLLAGRGPLVAMEPQLMRTPALAAASEIGNSITLNERTLMRKEHILRLPTIHVHGLHDPNVGLHRLMLEQYCESYSTRLLEWDGDHRVPIKSKEVAAVVAQIIDIAEQTGLLNL